MFIRKSLIILFISLMVSCESVNWTPVTPNASRVILYDDVLGERVYPDARNIRYNGTDGVLQFYTKDGKLITTSESFQIDYE
jgi:hypothetical protein